MKKLLLVSIITVAICAGSASMAQSDFLDSQKEIILDEIYSSPQYAPLIDVHQAKAKLSELTRDMEQVKSEYSKMGLSQNALEDKFGEIQVAIEYIIGDMKTMESRLKADLTKISLSSKQISNLMVELKGLDGDMAESRRLLQNYTRFLYEVHNSYYTSNELSSLKLLVKSDNIAVTMSREDLVEILLQKLKVMMDVINEKQYTYVELSRELNSEKMGYLDAVERYQYTLESMQDQKQHLYQLLSYIQGDLSKANQKVDDLFDSRNELASQLDRLHFLTDPQTQQILDENSEVFELLNEADRDDGNKYMSWPVFPIEYVGYHFRDTRYLEQYGEMLESIRLEIPQGREVRSPAPAIVYKTFESPDVGLSWVVLLHKFGYVSIISPLSEIYVSTGDVIQRGTIIGRSGGQPGTKGAGVDSAIPHLDLEILKNGEAIDPYSVLDISIFKDEETIPGEWKTKYLQDLYSREVDLRNVYELEGTTIEQRRDDFLLRYAKGPYRDPAIWYEGAEGTNINPLLGICIGFAETSFRNFKTENNIGNVGNDDSGDTVEYDTPLAGVTALYNVLNNQYLGEYQTLDQLSRYGNSDGYIYASSAYNRQKNIMNCLSAIYDANIPEDFAFRLE